MIDVLRATTVIAHALDAGASRIVPCLEVDKARQIKASDAADNVLLGGERGGLPIDGFDLGNSPQDYTAERVSGRAIAFTTTNGTRALESCRGASRVVTAAFVNLSAACASLTTAEHVEIVCAGTNGQPTREDILAAGAICESLGAGWTANDAAAIARAAWTSVSRSLAEELRDTQGGRNLIRLGLEGDIEVAAEADRFACVPVLDQARWQITLPHSDVDC